MSDLRDKIAEAIWAELLKQREDERRFPEPMIQKDRVFMYEVYEIRDGQKYLLLVTSSEADAKEIAFLPTDEIVKRWWVNE